MSRKIRYEEYASSGLEYLKIKVSDTPQNDKIKENQLSRTEKSIKTAANSHHLNDEYMTNFDIGYETISPHTSTPNDRDVARIKNDSKIHVDNDYYTRNNIHQSINKSTELSSSWFTAPSDPAGKLLNLSDQPLTCMSVQNNLAVVGSCDHALYVFDVKSCKKKRTLYTKRHGHREWITCVSFLSQQNEGKIISGGMDSKLCLWSANSTACTDLLGHCGSVSGLKANLMGTRVISSSYDKTLRLWNVNKKSELLYLKKHAAPVLCFTWSDCEKIVGSGDRDGVVILWDINSAGGNVIRKFKSHEGHATCIESLDNSNPNLIATGGQDGKVCVYDIRAKSRIYQLNLHTNSKGKGAICSIEHNGNTMITSGADGSIYVLDINHSFQTRFVFKEHSDFLYSTHLKNSVYFSGAGNGMMLVHNIDTGKLLYGLGANKAAVRCIATIDNEIITSGDDGNVLTYTIK